MLGWGIIVYALSPEEKDRADQNERESAILAKWDAGLFGIRWLAELVQSGAAEQLSKYGYPNKYTAKAKHILPIIKGEDVQLSDDECWVFCTDENGEEIAQPPGWSKTLQFHEDRILACTVDQILTIDAWDLS